MNHKQQTTNNQQPAHPAFRTIGRLDEGGGRKKLVEVALLCGRSRAFALFVLEPAWLGIVIASTCIHINNNINIITTMNWTGGQLRRHSARKGILSQTQRQNFAKSRQLGNDRVSHQPVSFPPFLNLRDKHPEESEVVVEKQDKSVSVLNF